VSYADGPFICLRVQPPPTSTLFPYTTLFRSVVTDADLVECDFGQWEGLTVEEIARRWPSELAAWQRSTAVAPPGGESLRRVTTRSEEHTSELQSRANLVCRLLREKQKSTNTS